jgi:transcription-repair coupling factor (superfamily II helicase)
VEISVDAYFPSTYISDTRQKIVFYQKAASLERQEDASELCEELTDRFGPLPPAALNLLNVASLKILAAQIGVAAVSEEKGQVVIRFSREHHPHSNLLLQAARKYQGRLTAATGKQLVLTLRPDTRRAGERVVLLLELFNELKNLVRGEKTQV